MFWSFGEGSTVSHRSSVRCSALKLYIKRENADNGGTANAVDHCCRLGMI